MYLANRHDLRRAAIASQERGDIQTVAALNLISNFPTDRTPEPTTRGDRDADLHGDRTQTHEPKGG